MHETLTMTKLMKKTQITYCHCFSGRRQYYLKDVSIFEEIIQVIYMEIFVEKLSRHISHLSAKFSSKALQLTHLVSRLMYIASRLIQTQNKKLQEMKKLKTF